MTEVNAGIRITYDPESGFFHVVARSLDATDADPKHILTLMQVIESSFTKGRLSVIRQEATVNDDKDSETHVRQRNGYARFSFKDEPGERQMRADGPNVMHLGLADGLIMPEQRRRG